LTYNFLVQALEGVS